MEQYLPPFRFDTIVSVDIDYIKLSMDRFTCKIIVNIGSEMSYGLDVCRGSSSSPSNLIRITEEVIRL